MLTQQSFIGTVQWYSMRKGYGFVSITGQEEDIFLHHSEMTRALQDKIKVGSKIEFDIKQGARGPLAININLVGQDLVLSEPEQTSKPTTAERDIVVEEIPTSSSAFSELGINPALVRAVHDLGFRQPTPIQAEAIPQVMTGEDVLGCAQTGTGKTAAFSLPMLHYLLETAPANKRKKAIRAVILAPTRELAIQIGADLKDYTKHVDLSHTVIYGGVGQQPQVRALKKGIDTLVATPGRLLDLIGQGHVDLSHVEVFVLDEADRMLDMGFIHDVKRVIKLIRNDSQMLMFSATMDRNVRQFARDVLDSPLSVNITPEQLTTELVEQSVMFVPKKQKQTMLEQVLTSKDVTRVLVFTRTKHGANRVVKKLVQKGIQAEPIHGNKSQTARQKALKNFRNGKTRVLVATDVASRGIDVDDISHVIQYDLPNEPETYVHRIGRTGRAGAEGIALAFCDDSERAYLRSIERLTGQRIPVITEYKMSKN